MLQEVAEYAAAALLIFLTFTVVSLVFKACTTEDHQ